MADPVLEELWSIKYEDLELDREIGRGAFGEVYLANYFGTQTAVKKIIINQDDPETKKFLVREIQLLKGMRHPNIVQLIGICKLTDSELYLVTEFVPQGDLRHMLKNPESKLPWSRRIRMAYDVACAMAYLHSRNVIFRDMKSKNVLVDSSQRCKLCDFGFARLKEQTPQGQTSKAAMTMCGTDDWMAPEVILGMDYDVSCDVFSFGIVLFELITRVSIRKELQRVPKDAFGLDEEKARSLVPSDCPKEFSELAFACCAYEPKKRPTFNQITAGLQVLAKQVEEDEAQRKEKKKKEKAEREGKREERRERREKKDRQGKSKDSTSKEGKTEKSRDRKERNTESSPSTQKVEKNQDGERDPSPREEPVERSVPRSIDPTPTSPRVAKTASSTTSPKIDKISTPSSPRIERISTPSSPRIDKHSTPSSPRIDKPSTSTHTKTTPTSSPASAKVSSNTTKPTPTSSPIAPKPSSPNPAKTPTSLSITSPDKPTHKTSSPISSPTPSPKPVSSATVRVATSSPSSKPAPVMRQGSAGAVLSPTPAPKPVSTSRLATANISAPVKSFVPPLSSSTTSPPVKTSSPSGDLKAGGRIATLGRAFGTVQTTTSIPQKKT